MKGKFTDFVIVLQSNDADSEGKESRTAGDYNVCPHSEGTQSKLIIPVSKQCVLMWSLDSNGRANSIPYDTEKHSKQPKAQSDHTSTLGTFR